MSQSVKLRNTVQPELIYVSNVKRTPYLLDYEGQRRPRENTAMEDSRQSRRSQPAGYGYEFHRQKDGYESYRPQSRSKAAARRRKIVRRQRLAVGMWVLCIIIISVWILTHKTDEDSSTQQVSNSVEATGAEPDNNMDLPLTGNVTVQGLPAEVFAAHPDWKEDFLTPNEYSRPGDTLSQIKNIFVHYTANPGTSAAQNRSYFEQQKDTHERSVSSHFIIGYEGEILQCVPLDEIAYAVQTRNEDSISIECCFLAEDGSFTKETYDSLIKLLAWLVDAYDLTSDDILRHYDCGGKKCPLYYTENPQKWEQLKADVKDKL